MKEYSWPILWMLFIAWLSVTPGSNLPDINFFAPDKLGHFFVYGMLVLLTLRAIDKSETEISNKMIVWTVLASSFYGFLLECTQFYITVDRYFENLDILANIIGSIGGGVFFNFFLKKK